MTFFSYITPVTYWILILLWTYILYFYIRRLRSNLMEDRLFYVLFVILSIDAFRTLFESCYFGAWYTSLAGFIPIDVHAFLVRPEMVFIPKVINVVAAVIVIFILLYRWIPHEQLAIKRLHRLVDKKSTELTREIDSRVKAEESVKKYAKNLETIFNNTHNILALINSEGRVEMINHRGAEFAGKSGNDVLGLLGGEVFNCINAFNEKGCGGGNNCSSCPIRSRVIDTLENGNNCKDEKGNMIFLVEGEEKHIHLLISTSLLELDGKPKVLLAILDNTEHVLNEKTIWDSNQKFEKVFNSHLDSILLLDASIPPKILAANDATEKILGYRNDELIGETTECLHVDELHLIKFREALESGLGKYGYLDDFEYLMKRKDGDIFTSEHRVVELKNDEDERTGWVSIIRDLTEKKKFREYLHQSQRMEAIGNLAGGIAHDFNNILFPIIGLAEMLLEDLEPGSSGYENARAICTAGIRGSELVKQILSFSRQSSHKTCQVNVQQILKEVYKLARATVPSSIEINRDIQQDCGTVLGDPTQIYQILMNLITNAFHAIETDGDKGKIKITLKQVAGEAYGIEKVALINGECLMLEVADDGCGIKKDIMGKLFEPYFTTKERGKGTGLGLAVVFGIIKELGGEISIQSKENEGTAFTVFLPLVPDDFIAKENDDMQSFSEHGSEKILLVDDEEPVAKLGKQMLERLGYQVSIFTNSLDALDKFKENPDYFDLVISDLTMPDMTGEQLSHELVKVNPDIPIIICSGFSEKIEKGINGSSGIKAFMKKPLVKSEMGRMIRKIIDNKEV